MRRNWGGGRIAQITPLRAWYVIPKDETTIEYIEKVGRKEIHKTVSLKGRLRVKPTLYNMTQLILQGIEKRG